MDRSELPGGTYAEIEGRVRAARHVWGQPHFALIDDGGRIMDRACADRLFRRRVSGRWRGEPVTVWASRTPGAVLVQFAGKDWDRASALGMRGDRTMWQLDVPPGEVTVTSVDEVDLR